MEWVLTAIALTWWAAFFADSIGWRRKMREIRDLQRESLDRLHAAAIKRENAWMDLGEEIRRRLPVRDGSMTAKGSE